MCTWLSLPCLSSAAVFPTSFYLMIPCDNVKEESFVRKKLHGLNGWNTSRLWLLCSHHLPCLGKHSTENSGFNYYFSGYFPKLETFFPPSVKSWQRHSRGLVNVMYRQFSIFVVVTFYKDANIELVNTETSVVNVSGDSIFLLFCMSVNDHEITADIDCSYKF